MNPQQYPDPQQPPKRKRRIWPWLLGAIAIIIVIAAASGGGHHDSTTASTPVAASNAPAVHNSPAPPVKPVEVTTIPPLTAAPNTNSGHTIVYEVIADSGLNSVTYFDANSAEKQDLNASAPWSKTVVNKSSYVIAGLGAQTNGQSVTCRITVDGKVADQQTATGQYAVVNCNASVD